MSNYIGVKCPVCNKRFAPSEDIVVCPVCGAPHHRQCYAETNNCFFAADHLSGKVWSPPESGQSDNEPSAGARDDGLKNCPRCGSANPDETIFCQVCGNRLMGAGLGARPDIFPGYGVLHVDPLGGINGEEKISGIPVTDLMLFIGPNTSYYLPHFYAIEKTGKRTSLNFAAFFLSFFYYFYRKMYRTGVILLGVYTVSLVPFFFFAWEVMPELLYQYGFTTSLPVLNENLVLRYADLTLLAFIVFIIASLAFSLFANYFYYKKAVSKAGKLLKEKKDAPEGSFYGYHRALAYSGGVNKLSVFLLIATIFTVTTFTNTIIISCFI